MDGKIGKRNLVWIIEMGGGGGNGEEQESILLWPKFLNVFMSRAQIIINIEPVGILARKLGTKHASDS